MSTDDTSLTFQELDELMREAEITARLAPILGSWTNLKALLSAEAARLEEQIVAIEEGIRAGEFSEGDPHQMPSILQDDIYLRDWHDESAILLRRSFVVSACSFLEAALIDACRPSAEDELEAYNTKVGSMKERVKTLLKRLFPDAPEGSTIGVKRWGFLCDMVKVRNFIVHSNGVLGLEQRRKTREYLKNVVLHQPGLAWRETAYDAELVMYDEYCDEVASLLGYLAPLIYKTQGGGAYA